MSRYPTPYADARCPACGAQLDAGLALQENRTPTPGAVSICAYCGTLGIFTDDDLRHPDEDEMRQLMHDPLIQRALAAVSVFIATNDRRRT